MNGTNVSVLVGETIATTPVETTITETQMVTALFASIGLCIAFYWAMKE